MMKETEIIEGNKLIAEFMGAHILEEDGRFFIHGWVGKNECSQHTPFDWCGSKKKTLASIYDSLLSEDYGAWGQFHKKWDWLMPVVEKIESLRYDVMLQGLWLSSGKEDHALRQICSMSTLDGKDVTSASSGSKIEAVFIAVVQFIQFYNTQKS